jgi:hypothetical protein
LQELDAYERLRDRGKSDKWIARVFPNLARFIPLDEEEEQNYTQRTLDDVRVQERLSEHIDRIEGSLMEQRLSNNPPAPEDEEVFVGTGEYIPAVDDNH